MRVGKMQRVELVVSTDSTRPHLQRTYLDVEEQKLVATDGACMVAVDVEVDNVETSGPVNTEALKEARKVTKKWGDAELFLGAKTCKLPDGRVYPREPDEGNFPEWKRVIPDYPEDAILRIGLNAHLLWKICQALGGEKASAEVVLTMKVDVNTGDPTRDPIKVVFESPELASNSAGYLIPVRIGKAAGVG